MAKCRYLIMAGGTGGHVFPALAVAEELMQRGAEVFWLGTQAGMEVKLVRNKNIKLSTIKIKGFRGKDILSKLSMPFLLCRAIWQAARIIIDVNPSVVIGFGGFVAAPGGIAAKILGKKLMIHEQNSVAGTTNRLLSNFANIRMEAFPASLKNAIHVGNPVRPGLVELRRDFQVNRKLRVLIMGGSLGAKAINDLAPSVFSGIGKQHRPEIWHQTGKDKIVSVLEAYQQKDIEARVDEFISDIASAYEWADLLICRAGALTVSEVAVVGMPAIFIPLPSAIDNHQFYNAQWLVKQGAALLIEQKSLTLPLLINHINQFIQDREQLKIMSQKVNQLALSDAATQAANLCEELCKGVSHAV